jgi:chorismate synthase
VAAGAVAMKLLSELGIKITAYTKQIGPVICREENVRPENIEKSPLRMPDLEASAAAEDYLAGKMKELDSSGGLIECVIAGMPAGVGEPVFGKLDALLAGAVMSIGAVKGVEIGEGFGVVTKTGSQNNDGFYMDADGRVKKKTNHAGGILGGISDGSDIVIRAAFKPTPSIFQKQETVNQAGENIQVQIKGRHDPIIVPRAVVVVESMAAVTIVDRLFVGMTSRIDKIRDFYTK